MVVTEVLPRVKGEGIVNGPEEVMVPVTAKFPVKVDAPLTLRVVMLVVLAVSRLEVRLVIEP